MRFNHPIMRAKERYGLDLTVAQIVEAEERIKRGDAVLHRAKTPDITTSMWLINGVLTRVVVRGNCICTFLPLNDAKPRFKKLKIGKRDRSGAHL